MSLRSLCLPTRQTPPAAVADRVASHARVCPPRIPSAVRRMQLGNDHVAPLTPAGRNRAVSLFRTFGCVSHASWLTKAARVLNAHLPEMTSQLSRCLSPLHHTITTATQSPRYLPGFILFLIAFIASNRIVTALSVSDSPQIVPRLHARLALYKHLLGSAPMATMASLAKLRNLFYKHQPRSLFQNYIYHQHSLSNPSSRASKTLCSSRPHSC